MNRKRSAWTVWALSVAFVLVSIPLDASVPSRDVDIVWYLMITTVVLLYATVGALITSRQTGNRVGLLFTWVALSASASIAAGAYASLGVARGLPFVAAASWVSQAGLVAMMGPLAFLFLIFPTGSPPSRRWRWLLRTMLVAFAITGVLFALTPGPMRSGFADLHSDVENPIGLPASWKDAIEALTVISGSILFGGAIISVLSLLQRYRRADTTERGQIRLLAWLGAITGAYLVIMLSLEAAGAIPENGVIENASFIVVVFLVFLGIPLTCAVAILKHGLWDLDVVVRKTVQYGVILAASLIALALLAIVPGLLAIGIPREILPGIAVGLGLAGFIALVRPRAQRFANRIVYGRRSTPYEVLSQFAERIGETYSTEDVLPRMAQLLGEATGARAARVWLRVGGSLRPEASWPADALPVADVPMAGDAVPTFGTDRAFEVRHHGELLGALTVAQAPEDPFTPWKEKLARDMAAQAGLVLRNVRLIEDLRESRRRIVAAQDERAKKLERDIHDGAQQQLVALTVKLRLLEQLAARDPGKAAELATQLRSETTQALEDLRDLARGIYPPLLADEGLPAALTAQARKSPVPVTVDADGIGRFSQDVEAAVYFSCLEALQNVAKYAEASRVVISLAKDDGRLSFSVTDDGVGFDPAGAHRGSGLQGIEDRLDALSGRFEVRSRPGAGTTVSGSVPVG